MSNNFFDHQGLRITQECRFCTPTDITRLIAQEDFSLVLMVQLRSAGEILTSIARTADGPIGFSLTISQDSSITFFESHGSIQRTTVSKFMPLFSRAQCIPSPKTLIDGESHSIAIIREEGKVRISVDEYWEDQTSVTPAGAPDYIDISSPAPIQTGVPLVDMTLVFVGLWKRPLTNHEVLRAAFNFDDQLQDQLLGFWTLNGTLKDKSLNAFDLIDNSSPIFEPVLGCHWITRQPISNYTFLQIHNTRGNPGSQVKTITATRYIRVEDDARWLFASLVTSSEDSTPPPGVIVKLDAPDCNRYYGTPEKNISRFMTGVNGGLQTLVMKSPQFGFWKIRVEAPSQSQFIFQFHATGSAPKHHSMVSALAQVLPNSEFDPSKQRGILGMAIAVGVVCGAVVAVASIPLSGGGTAPIVIAGLFGALGATGWLYSYAPERTSFHQAQQNYHKASKEKSFPILMIDQNLPGDQGGATVATRRKEFLWDNFLSTRQDNPKFITKRIERKECTPDAISQILREQPGLVYITASGHGSYGALFGTYVNVNDYKIKAAPERGAFTEIINTGFVEQNPGLFKGRVFNFLACNCGYDATIGLGRKIEAVGGTFIGYRDAYSISRSKDQYPNESKRLAKLTVKAAVEVDKAILNGSTVGAAVDAAKKAYTKYQEGAGGKSNENVQFLLGKNRDLLVAYGNLDLKLF